MAPEIGVGLIGYGAIGRLHALCYRMLPLAYPDLPLMPRLVAVATASLVGAAAPPQPRAVRADLAAVLLHQPARNRQSNPQSPL